MKPNSLAFCLTLFLAVAFSPAVPADLLLVNTLPKKSIDLQGHRGARGLFPENTIPAFLYALDLGVSTLEMDVVINSEGHVILSHEPWMSAKICLHPDGRNIDKSEEKSLKIFTMSDEEVRSYDCGSHGHTGFPDQKTMKVSKPSLDEVLEAVRLRTAETQRTPVHFNVEIKSSPEGDDVFHPRVDQFARALYDVLNQHEVLERSSIQSFDPRALEAAHNIDPGISIVLLVDNRAGFKENLKRLSFTPDIYSPNYKRVNKGQIEAAHAQDILVIPWTVNNEKVMRKLVDLGVDGLITDYPDMGIKVLAEIQQNP